MLPSDVVFTEKLRELFYRCFVEGKKNRVARPSAKEFAYALLDASNKVIKCPSCGAWHYPRKTGVSFNLCPWCDGESKPKARLNFYDSLLEGKDYKAGKSVDGKPQGKLVNSYILREGKNLIKSLYVLRYDDPSKVTGAAENFMTIAKNDKGYWAYNEFSKEGIVIKKFNTGEYGTLGNNQAVLLEIGDEICFDFNINIEVGGKEYSFIRTARFMEEVQ